MLQVALGIRSCSHCWKAVHGESLPARARGPAAPARVQSGKPSGSRFRCGVALCMAHAIVEPRYLTRTAVINRVELVEPSARVVHCPICASAEKAQTRPAGRRNFILGIPYL